MWEYCGMSRSKAGLEKALELIPALREEFWDEVCICGGPKELNVALEQAGRVADFMDFGELLVRDALTREESCGAHFREEHQTADGEAARDDARFAHVAAWEWTGDGREPLRHREPLDFESIPLAERNYK